MIKYKYLISVFCDLFSFFSPVTQPLATVANNLDLNTYYINLYKHSLHKYTIASVVYYNMIS